MHTFIIAAVSADGFIACHDSHRSTNWTSREDLRFFRERTQRAGVCVMGSSTFATIGKPLPGRVSYVYTSAPEKLGGHGDQVRPTELPPEELLKEIAGSGYSEVAICGGASVYGQFLQAGVVDTLYLTYEPVLFGQGISLSSVTLDLELELQGIEKLNQNTVLHTYHLHRAKPTPAHSLRRAQ